MPEETNINQSPQDTAAALEALLFAYGEPIARKKILSVLNESLSADGMRFSKEDVDSAIEHLQKIYESQERGLNLLVSDERIQLATKPKLNHVLKAIVTDEMSETLTPAALETLSIIAYAGPISRAAIEYIRGVNSSFILRMLVLRGLIERVSNEKRSNAYAYRASFDLLRHLGLEKLEDLPDYSKYRDVVANFNSPQQAQ
ncbi:MAG: hypothetical protein COU07_00565 [Candidatus Harrisonbacteria bacterium CG10_big_fil_rev_8_21_14_0_10_40_38]|uniref:SMC-Scp complex subunit ScpB n=1 Tax=Candidatus Harrisonbacteria bacterium CG10_big_fil_rev_8_21_14_0_10_40_38 TaxID=1974583 RepID=A0A2H0USI9_9BACT|nr:MAG: hypothetical protein COU07_00565 [Candidatus Harrisonbacteria bacterium CG10_big_fil_rev_8_21_14_0_10_40_38]